MNKSLMVAVLAWVSALAPLAATADDLPPGMPTDLPFPTGVSLNVTSQELSAGTAYIVGFSFSGDVDAVYGDFRRYAVANGYEIAIETDAGGKTFSSSRGPGAALMVRIHDTGSVKVGSVTLRVPED